jgi:hypothetical protein
MRVAAEHYVREGWSCTNRSASEPYDLHLSRGGHSDLRVEVKGTRSAGSIVLLTRNEVCHAPEHYPNVALFVVHSVDVQVGPDGRPVVSGGRTLFTRSGMSGKEPWNRWRSSTRSHQADESGWRARRGVQPPPETDRPLWIRCRTGVRSPRSAETKPKDRQSAWGPSTLDWAGPLRCVSETPHSDGFETLILTWVVNATCGCQRLLSAGVSKRVLFGTHASIARNSSSGKTADAVERAGRKAS